MTATSLNSPSRNSSCAYDALVKTLDELKQEMDLIRDVTNSELSTIRAKVQQSMKNCLFKKNLSSVNSLSDLVISQILKHVSIETWNNLKYVNKQWYSNAISQRVTKKLCKVHFPELYQRIQLKTRLLHPDWSNSFQVAVALYVIKQDIKNIKITQRRLKLTFIGTILISTGIILAPYLQKMYDFLWELRQRQVFEYMRTHPGLDFEAASLELDQAAVDLMYSFYR